MDKWFKMSRNILFIGLVRVRGKERMKHWDLMTVAGGLGFIAIQSVIMKNYGITIISLILLFIFINTFKEKE